MSMINVAKRLKVAGPTVSVMEVLLNGKDSLEALFASIRYDAKERNRSNEDTDRILPGGRTLIKNKKLPEQILELFMKTKMAHDCQSN